MLGRGQLDRFLTEAVGFVEVDRRRVPDRAALVGARNVAARRALGRQADRIQVVDDRLRDRNLARAEIRVSERIFHFAEVADVEAFANDDDATARFAELFVHLVGHLGESSGRLGKIDKERRFAFRVGEARGGRDEADFASHRLQDENRVGRGGTAVFLFGVLDCMRPIFRRRRVAGRVVDELELRVANIVVDRLRNADRLQIEAASAGEFGDFVGGVHRVVSAVVEEVADVVRLKNLDDALEIFVLPRL